MKNNYWFDTVSDQNKYSKICQDLEHDVVIVGAGLTGLSCAYHLLSANIRAIIIEADTPLFGASGRNTGKISYVHGAVFNKLIQNYDLILAKQYYHANYEAIESIASIIETLKIDCDFERCNALLFTNNPDNISTIKDEYQAFIDVGIEAQYVEESDIAFPIKGGILSPNHAKFNPYKYGLGLIKHLLANKIKIYTNANVEEIINNPDGSYTLQLPNYKVRAKRVILATQFPAFDYHHLFFSKMRCEKGSLVASQLSNSGSPTIALNIDSPSHSVNCLKDHAIVAGKAKYCGRKSEVDQDTFQLQAQKAFDIGSFEYSWTNQDYVSFDCIPLIGKMSKGNSNLLFASGYSKWGNSTSEIAGKILCGYILEKVNKYQYIFSPQRYHSLFHLPFVKENLSIGYNFIKSKLHEKSALLPSINQANYIVIDNHTYGAYCDHNSNITILDVTCPHLGCTLKFNQIEKSWDCPCHGSRFSIEGDIIKGPATYHLNRYGEGLNHINPHIFKSK